MNKPILMKLYTVAVDDLKMCMKERYPGRKYFKEDNDRGGTVLFFCNLTHSSSWTVQIFTERYDIT